MTASWLTETVEQTRAVVSWEGPGKVVILGRKKGRVPGSFPQTPGPQVEVKVQGNTVLTYGVTDEIYSPAKGPYQSHSNK